MRRVACVAAAAAIGLSFGLPLASLQGERARRDSGYPGLDQLQRWGCADARLLRWPAESRARRRLALPPSWPRRGRDAPALLVFVEGRRLPFVNDVSSDDPSGIAYYQRRPGGGLELLVACPGELPCGEIAAIGEDRVFEACVARGRLQERPRTALLAALGAALCALVAFYGLRSPRALAGGVVASSAFAGLWFALRLYRGARPAAVLSAFALALTLPLLLRHASALNSWSERLLARADASLARVSVTGLEQTAPWVATALAAALALPLAFTRYASLGDWGLHFYNVVRHTASLQEGVWSSPFLHAAPYGAFYPWFAFYGGTLYAITSALGAGLTPVLAYKLTYLAAFALSYVGALWWARLAGVSVAFAHAAGLLSISSAYWLSLAYGKGAWAELIASSVLPLLLAAAMAHLRAQPATRAERAALVAGWVLLSGSHTVTFVWGGLFAAAFVAGLLMLRRLGSLEPLARLCMGVLLGIGLNGWFLGPVLAYGNFTRIAEFSSRGFGLNNPQLNSLAVIFHPGRYLPEGVDAEAFVQVSLYALAWAVAAGVASFHRMERRDGLALSMAAFGALLFLSLLTQGRDGWFWKRAPAILRATLFPPRLHVFLSLCVLSLVLLGLRAISRSPRRRLWTLAFLVALCAQLGLAGYQVATSPRSHPISVVERLAHLPSVPAEYRHDFDYRFATRRDGSGLGPEVDAPATLELDLTTVRRDRVQVVLPPGQPGPFAANISYSPLIQARGDIVLLGRTRQGLAVIAPAAHGVGEARGWIESAWPAPRLAGLALTGLALIGSLVFVGRDAAGG